MIALPPEVEVGARVARAAGALIAEYHGDVHSAIQIELKTSATDIVTSADKASEKLIVDLLCEAFPNDGILSEERAEIGSNNGRRWIIDPLDGTANFVRSLWPFAVSIGFEQDDKLIGGFVHDPLRDQLHWAWKDLGARSNGVVQVREEVDIRRAFIGLSGTNRLGEIEARVDAQQKLTLASDSLRDYGSTAMMLALVAGGGLDAHVAMNVQPWDVAAGLVIAQEAGCVIDRTPQRTIVGPPGLVRQIGKVLDDPPTARRP